VQVSDSDEIMLISDKGTLVRTRVEEVSVQGRNTQGVRLIRLKVGENLVGLEQVDEPDPGLVSKLEEQIEDADSNESSTDNLEPEVVDTKIEDFRSDSDTHVGDD
jgi:DNA gyrase subunit A